MLYNVTHHVCVCMYNMCVFVCMYLYVSMYVCMICMYIFIFMYVYYVGSKSMTPSPQWTLEMTFEQY